jgi:frizzled protein 9/10
MQFPNASEDAASGVAPVTTIQVRPPVRRHNWLEPQITDPTSVLTPIENPCPPNFARARDLSSVTCSPQCGKDAYFSSRDKTFAEAWMSGWAWLCFISTLFTLLTFWVEPSRFRYPERPVVFLALCYNIISLAFIVRGILGAEKLSCLTTDEDSYVVTEGLESAPCTLIFLILYYFSLASAVWWLVLTISWFLSAAKKWSSEALHGLASFFHTAAWGGPAIASGAVLAMRRVAGDELTGLCFVAEPAVLGFVVLPHALLLLVGAALAAAGGTALVQVRQAMRCAGRDTAKLERLMTRLGVFAALYVIPALGALVCWMYEAANRPRWKSRAHLAALGCRIGSDKGCIQPIESSGGVEVALLRVFLSLVVGVTSGMWVWSSKTCKAWRSIFSPRKHQKIYTTPAKVTVINHSSISRNTPIAKV